MKQTIESPFVRAATFPIHSAIILLLVTSCLLLTSCSVPFSVETDTVRVTLSTSLGLTAEQAVPIPDDARRSNVSYSRVEVHYDITASGEAPVEVTLYVSPDQTPDGVRGSGDETIVQERLDADTGRVSGTTDSRVLRDVLNEGRESFVIGGSVASLDPGQEVTVEAYAEVSGSYRVFP